MPKGVNFVRHENKFKKSAFIGVGKRCKATVVPPCKATVVPTVVLGVVQSSKKNCVIWVCLSRPARH